MEHARRLRRENDTANTYGGLAYRVQIENANAADFGVPQKRERMFMVGLRSDLEVDWTFPRATHSQDALLWDQWITGEYWDRHRIATSDRPSTLHAFDADSNRFKGSTYHRRRSRGERSETL